MTPEMAVARLVDILVANPDFSEESIYEAMAHVGISDALAHRTYMFTQTAWGRLSLKDMGITFSPDYLCLDAEGNIVESGRLADDPSYTTARQLAPHYLDAKGYQNLVLSSADFRAVNQALWDGTKLPYLLVGPACLFIESPTEVGMQKAQKIITQHLQANWKLTPTDEKPLATKTAKPWWQFWK